MTIALNTVSTRQTTRRRWKWFIEVAASTDCVETRERELVMMVSSFRGTRFQLAFMEYAKSCPGHARAKASHALLSRLGLFRGCSVGAVPGSEAEGLLACNLNWR